MADFHAADLWVAVVPDASRVGPTMEQAGKDAKDKFGAGARDIGKGINDDLTKVGENAKDTFSKAGRESGASFGREIRSTVGNEVKGAFSDIASTVRSGDIAGAFEGLKSKIGGISDIAKEVGVDITGWVPSIGQAKGEIDGFDTQVKEGLTSVTGVTSMFEGLPGKIGAAATAMGEFALVITSALEISKQLLHTIDSIPAIHDRFMNPDGTPKSSIDDWADRNLPDWANPNKWGLDDNYHPRQQGGTVSSPGIEPYPEHFIGPIPKGAVRAPGGAAPPTPAPDDHPHGSSGFYKDWYGGGSGDSTSTGPSGRSGGSSGGSGGGRSSAIPRPSLNIGGVSDRAGVGAAGSRIANLYAVADSLVGTPYSQELRNDCSGLVNELAAAALGLPPPPASQRFSTPNEGDWLLSHGFKMGRGGPGDLRIGWNPAPGNAGHTAATLPGGEHAESGGSHGSFLVGPGAAGADDPFFTQHAYLPMGGGKGGAGGQAPAGTQQDPVYTADAPSGAGGTDSDSGSSAESQGQQLGQGLGKGFLQLFGLDGSVFGKSPLDFGAVKLGGGLLNWGLGQAKAMGAVGGGGGMAGGGGGIGAALTGLIPSPGAMVSAAAAPGGGSIGLGGQGGAGAGPTNIHNEINLTGNFKDNTDMTRQAQWTQNANRYDTGTLPRST